MNCPKPVPKRDGAASSEGTAPNVPGAVGEDEPRLLRGESIGAPLLKSTACARSIPIHLKVFGPEARNLQPQSMTEETPSPRFREHLREMREGLAGIGKDVKLDVADAPHLVKEGTKNVLAAAAGIRRTSMREWTEPTPTDKK